MLNTDIYIACWPDQKNKAFLISLRVEGAFVKQERERSYKFFSLDALPRYKILVKCAIGRAMGHSPLHATTCALAFLSTKRSSSYNFIREELQLQLSANEKLTHMHFPACTWLHK